jgi:hypothetical protein
MPSYLGKNRKKAKEKELKEDETEQKHADISDPVGGDSPDMGSKEDHEKDRVDQGREDRGVEGSVGKFIKIDRRKTDADLRKERERYESADRILRLNQHVEYILSCLEPEANQNFHTAAFDAKVKDIGIYILGILNRMHKMADYFEPDIEFEWEDGVVGYSEDLYCQYCHKKIERPTNLKQLFCSNICARDYKNASSTGVIFPSNVQRGPTVEEMEEKQWEREQKRIGSAR